MSNDIDAIVIGAGGGGAVAAKELGEKGLKVILLEAGPWYGNSLWPNPNSERGAIRSSNYEDLSIELLKKSFTDLEDDMNNFFYGKFRWGPANREEGPWPRKLVGRGYTWQNSGVGGSTLHYLANCPRAYPESINNKWPITYEELVPYYEIVERALPVIPAASTPKEDLFYYGAQKAGWSLLDSPDVTVPGYRPQPNAILRPNLMPGSTDPQSLQPVGCTLRGHCINGCHIGPTVEGVAKRSTLVSYIPRALATGNVEIRPNAFVIKIITEERNNIGLQAVGVQYRDTWTGEIIELKAKVIIMAAGGIETPRLWLNSNLPENDWVGKGLINHWMDCVSGIFDENVLMEVLGVPAAQPFIGQNAAARLDYPGLGAIEPIGFTPGIFSSFLYGTSYKGYSMFHPSNLDVPWDAEGLVVGEKLKENMMAYPRTLSILILTDDEENQRNGVTLDPVVQDKNGFIPVINYEPSEVATIKRDRLAYIAADILKNAGAKTIMRSNWPPEAFIHIACTMRMGYVTDTNCEALQVKRLFVSDCSVLYNGLGGVNPTLTAQALATRTCDKIFELYFSSAN